MPSLTSADQKTVPGMLFEIGIWWSWVPFQNCDSVLTSGYKPLVKHLQGSIQGGKPSDLGVIWASKASKALKNRWSHCFAVDFLPLGAINAVPAAISSLAHKPWWPHCGGSALLGGSFLVDVGSNPVVWLVPCFQSGYVHTLDSVWPMIWLITIQTGDYFGWIVLDECWWLGLRNHPQLAVW